MTERQITQTEQTQQITAPLKMSDYEYRRQAMREKLVREAFTTALKKAWKAETMKVMAILDNSDEFKGQTGVDPLPPEDAAIYQRIADNYWASLKPEGNPPERA